MGNTILPEPTLTSADLELLQELGLKECNDLDTCEKVIDTLRMRQLDKLKMALSRIAKTDSIFSPEVTEGIRRNDLRMFARAVHTLTSKQFGKR